MAQDLKNWNPEDEAQWEATGKAIAMLIVPLSLWVTMLVTRILPRPRGKGALLAL